MVALLPLPGARCPHTEPGAAPLRASGAPTRTTRPHDDPTRCSPCPLSYSSRGRLASGGTAATVGEHNLGAGHHSPLPVRERASRRLRRPWLVGDGRRCTLS